MLSQLHTVLPCCIVFVAVQKQDRNWIGIDFSVCYKIIIYQNITINCQKYSFKRITITCFRPSKPKRNGIVTNPALRIVPAIKNGLEMAAGRKINTATTTNSFQWRKETPL